LKEKIFIVYPSGPIQRNRSTPALPAIKSRGGGGYARPMCGLVIKTDTITLRLERIQCESVRAYVVQVVRVVQVVCQSVDEPNTRLLLSQMGVWWLRDSGRTDREWLSPNFHATQNFHATSSSYQLQPSLYLSSSLPHHPHRPSLSASAFSLDVT
jgi:hypothetical protein